MKSENFQARLKSVYSVFIVVATCIICKFLFSFLRICFIPGYPYNFRYLVIVFFNFTVYDIIFIFKKKKICRKYQEYGTCMQQHLFDHFSEEGHHVFLKDVSIKLIDKTDPSNPLQRENYWRSTPKTMAPWRLNVEDCVCNSVLLYSYHWICTDCNKDLTYGNNFGTDYYCSYFHHFHCCCRFYDSVAFIVAASAIVLVFFLSLLLKLV